MKSRKVKHKRPKKPKSPTPEEPETATDGKPTMENRPSSSKKQYPPSSKNTSLKVLLESTKENLRAELANRANQKVEEEKASTSDNVVQRGLQSFNENMKKNVTDSGAVDMEGFMNYGMEEGAVGGQEEMTVNEFTPMPLPQDVEEYFQEGKQRKMEEARNQNVKDKPLLVPESDSKLEGGATWMSVEDPPNSSGTDSVDSEKEASSLVVRSTHPPPKGRDPEEPTLLQSYSVNPEALELFRTHWDNILPDNHMCIFEDCKKAATVSCLTCDRFLYCTDKHRKRASKTHEPYCNAYRNIETKLLGRHSIAARDINMECPTVIQHNTPLAVLPLNPNLYAREFPRTYCVKCFANKNEEVYECRNCPERVDCPSCGVLKVCSWKCLREKKWTYEGLSSHAMYECDILKTFNIAEACKKDEDKCYILYDQSVLGMLRCLPVLGHTNARINPDCVQFLELLKMIPKPPGTEASYSKNFQSKLALFRDMLPCDMEGITPERLYQLDQALLRFGRNIGPNIVTFKDACSMIPTWFVRCIYVNLIHVIHSCVPNCVLLVRENLIAELTAIKNIKKGDVLSFCYDERFLFIPTRDRHKLLFRDFGYVCKCKRCTSQSELNTYFASFPCSKPKCKGYLVPEHTLDPFSVWFCSKCRKTPVPYLRVIDVTHNFEDELSKPILENDVLGLVDLMHELVDQNYLHWNHHLIFNASLKLFDLIWEALCTNDLEVITAFSESGGLKFLKPAETIINITQVFMPDGYYHDYILQLRLSCLIKVRQLTDQLNRKETTLSKLNSFVKDLYFRTHKISECPLFERPARRNSIPGTNKYLRVLESKVMKALMKKVLLDSGTNYNVKAEELWMMHSSMKNDIQEVAAQADVNTTGIFPYGIDI